MVNGLSGERMLLGLAIGIVVLIGVKNESTGVPCVDHLYCYRWCDRWNAAD